MASYALMFMLQMLIQLTIGQFAHGYNIHMMNHCNNVYCNWVWKHACTV